MDLQEVQKIYDELAKLDYKNIYSDFLELPSMLNAVGDISGKKLLDVGCGTGKHIKKYSKLGANCYGIDISEKSIILAKEKNPIVNFKVASINKIPFKNNEFNVVTASLSIHYQDDLLIQFKEINRVLKKEGLFYFSTQSIPSFYKQNFQDDEKEILGTGIYFDKKTNKRLNLADDQEKKINVYLNENAYIQIYKKKLSSYLKNLRSAGFELIDVIDCKPSEKFKKISPENYDLFSKLPVFNIYVAIKKTF